MEFVEFPKLSRLNREVIVTEKIDGTNAQILICTHEQLVTAKPGTLTKADPVAQVEDMCIYAGSRTRFINVGDDNAGFARWVLEHADELISGLGAGLHFGEWWGCGIQRGYGLKEKRFSLFNVHRWADDAVRPACCHVVPELARGLPLDASFDIYARTAVAKLLTNGSVAAPGFMRPEGIVVFHVASNTGFKYTFDKHDGHKGAP